MKLLSISSLASWIHCPRQFFVQSVLEIKEPINSAMALGLVKHKFHEFLGKNEERIVSSLSASDSARQVLEGEYRSLLIQSVKMYVGMLRSVNVLPGDAMKSALPLVVAEADSRASLIAPLLKENMTGDALWQALEPKVKNEYSVESKSLGIKGRIDKLECYNDRLVPIELKSGKTPEQGVFEHHRIQAVSYALMLEDTFQSSVPQAIVHYVDSNARRDVVVDIAARNWVVSTVSAVRSCLESKQVPIGCGKEYCSACKTCDDSRRVTLLLQRGKV